MRNLVFFMKKEWFLIKNNITLFVVLVIPKIRRLCLPCSKMEVCKWICMAFESKKWVILDAKNEERKTNLFRTLCLLIFLSSCFRVQNRNLEKSYLFHIYNGLPQRFWREKWRPRRGRRKVCVGLDTRERVFFLFENFKRQPNLKTMKKWIQSLLWCGNP